MSDENTEIKIDKEKAFKIMQKVILTEAKNLNSRQISNMVKEIQNIIEEEVQCL
mgnify:CR=1 FL=1